MATEINAREFYRRWIAAAFSHAIGPIDLWSGLIAALLTVVGHFLPAVAPLMTDLLWQTPLWAAAAVVVARLLVAPYWIWKAQEQAILDLKTEVASLRREYDFAFAFDGIEVHESRRMDPESGKIVEIFFQPVLKFRNTLGRPIRYRVTKLSLDGKSLEESFINRGGVVAAMSSTTFYCPRQPLNLALMDKEREHDIEFEIRYGSPDE
ncbi:MAG: hypothetical protein ABI399_13865, partial [Bauldia sp.]